MTVVLELPHGELLELADARGTTLRVRRGTVWLTQARDRRDIVLEAGEGWTVERQGLTVAEAQGDVALALDGGRLDGVGVRARRGTWQDRLAAWLERLADTRWRQRAIPYF